MTADEDELARDELAHSIIELRRILEAAMAGEDSAKEAAKVTGEGFGV